MLPRSFLTLSPRLIIPALLLALSAQGCGGGKEVGLVSVEGLVTLNGAPLPAASVIFRPTKGRPSIGITDTNGRYRLEYLEGRKGAIPGPHKVSISTFVEPDRDSSDPLRQKGRPELVPAQYNAQTTLVANLKPEENEVADFDLETRKSLAQARRRN